MDKIVNCHAIQPTKKPNFRDKSTFRDSIGGQNLSHSPMINQVQKFYPYDCIRETPGGAQKNISFKQNLLNTKNHDLASSFSFSSFSEEETDYEYQKLLFAKFLQAKEAEWPHFMHVMNKISQQHLVSFVKIGGDQQTIRNNRVLSHYLGIWLESMGYKDIQTRKRLVLVVRFLYPEEQDQAANLAGILYDKLFQGYLPQSLQRRVLLEVCKRGWEYLAMFIARFIKIFKKYKNLAEQNFIDEVQKAIL